MIDVLTNIGIIAGAVLGLGVIWTSGIKPVYRFLRRMEAMHDYILVELPTWQKEVNVGLKQLYPNSGSSIHDKVMCTNEKVTETGNELAQVRAMFEAHINDHTVHTSNPAGVIVVNPTDK